MDKKEQKSYKYLKDLYQKIEGHEEKVGFLGQALVVLTDSCRQKKLEQVVEAFEQLQTLCAEEDSEEIQVLLAQGGINLVAACGETKRIEEAEKLFDKIRESLRTKDYDEKFFILARGFYNMTLIGGKTLDKDRCVANFTQLRKIAEKAEDEKITLLFAEAVTSVMILYINYHSIVEAKAVFTLIHPDAELKGGADINHIKIQGVVIICHGFYAEKQFEEGLKFLQDEKKLFMDYGSKDDKDEYQKLLEKFQQANSG